MGDQNSFLQLIRLIRNGDEAAAEQLVREYEPLIRREVRLRLEDQRLARAFDSVDVSQSVLASFFLRASAGQYDLDRPEQLAALLFQMARNKLASRVRYEYRARRDIQRVEPASDDLDHVPDKNGTASSVVEMRELLEKFRNELTDEERQLADLRSQGVAWAQIAQDLGGTEQARRMQLSRAIDRICEQLGLES